MELETGDNNKMEASDNKLDAKKEFFAVAVVAGAACISIGTVLGFSAVLLPELREELDDLDKDQARMNIITRQLLSRVL